MYKKYHLKAKKTRKQNDKKKGTKKPSKKSKKTRKNIKGGAKTIRKKTTKFHNDDVEIRVIPDILGVKNEDSIMISDKRVMWECTNCSVKESGTDKGMKVCSCSGKRR